MKRASIILLGVALLFQSCTTTGPLNLFGKRSPHEQYGQRLTTAGLHETTLGKTWFRAAEESLNKPLNVRIPYKETGYFAAEKIRAAAIRFEAKRGEKISISLQKKPSTGFTVYVDLWEIRNSNNKKLVAFADTGGNSFNYEIDDTGFYLLRLQPELLASGEYTLTIANGPSLAFPVESGRIGSFWGADRDGGARQHEGIDIFASKRTPALAAANGTVNRVTTNELGGKVVFLRPENKNYTLYYAHLDEQLVSAGQRVKVGDTIGLVGNTGNAISTSPHLHFGIYTFNGAIDPLTFVNPDVKSAPPVRASLDALGTIMRTDATNLRKGNLPASESLDQLAANTLVEVQSASSNSYKVILPDGRSGFINASSLRDARKTLTRITLDADKPLFDKPSVFAARKGQVNRGTSVKVLGAFENFNYVSTDDIEGWLESN